MSDKVERRSFLRDQARAKPTRTLTLEDGTIIHCYAFPERSSPQSDPNRSAGQNDQPPPSSSVSIYDAEGKLIFAQD